MMNGALARIAPSPSASVVGSYRGDTPLVDLTAGTPWFGPPESFRLAMADLVTPAAAGRQHHDTYAPAQGTPRLRAAIRALYQQDHGLDVDADMEVLVTHGGTGAVWTAVLTTTDAGDEVLLPDPCYSLYEPILLALGRRPVRVAGDPASGLLVDPAAVHAAIRPRTRLLMLNSPVNPTGSVYDEARLAAIAEVAAAADVVVVLDEVLDCFCWERPHVPLLAVRRRGVLTVNSLSKRLGITGWRLGWLAGDPDLIESAVRLHALQSIAVNHAAQLAAAAAVLDADRTRIMAQRSAAVLQAGTRFVREVAAVPGFPEDLRMPDGGVYAFVDVTGIARRHGSFHQNQPSDIGVMTLLRDRCGVAVLPGSAFGPAGAGRVRISLAAAPDQLDLATRRLADLW